MQQLLELIKIKTAQNLTIFCNSCDNNIYYLTKAFKNKERLAKTTKAKTQVERNIAATKLEVELSFAISASRMVDKLDVKFSRFTVIESSADSKRFCIEPKTVDCSLNCITKLSIALNKEYGGAFNKSSLWRMIQFYECFPIRDALSLELNWHHYRYIMRVGSLEERAKYGDKLIERLSIELTNRYGKGFDIRKLNRMKLFYSLFSIWETVSPKLGWSHYMLIITIKNIQARDYYIGE